KGSHLYGQTCNNLSSLYHTMKQYKKAEELALEAKKVYEHELPEGHPSRTIQLNNLGQLYYSMGKYKVAETFFLQARQLWKKALGTEHPYYIANSDDLARVYWQSNQTGKANDIFTGVARSKYNQLNKIFDFTNESEKQLYLKNINGSSDEYYSFYYKKIPHNMAGQSFTISLANRNLILSSTQQTRQAIYNSGDTSLSKVYQEWTTIKAQLANLYSLGGTAKPETIKILEDKADVFEKELSRKSSVFKKLKKETDWHEIQKNLANNESAIEFVEFQLQDGNRWSDSILYVALVLKKDKDPLLVPLFEKNQLDSLLGKKSFDEVNTIHLRYTSPSLFNLVWQPIEKHLKGITKVYFAPAGKLFTISFGAIPINNNRLLSDKYHLIQLNTTAMVTSQVPQYLKPTDNLQLYGGIKYDPDTNALKVGASIHPSNFKTSHSLRDDLRGGKTFQYLPGTQEEVEEIKKLADRAGTQVSILSGINATEESLKSMNGASSPAILHIATHGFFFPDPATNQKDSVQRKFTTSGKAFKQSTNPLMRSGLLFAGSNNAWHGRFITGIEDGILTAYEVSTTLYLPNTKLVVLSACETALGDIEGSEGVYGLQRAFKIAGVQNLVMSLWKVPDAETSAFMQVFYTNLFNKLSVSDAFHKAQNAMKVKYRNEPYKWAAWVFIR
ncbi:MAG: CHAT domain-containing tetratricopeptide repeat protein, partial [Chitinophagaceae bacterium]